MQRKMNAIVGLATVLAMMTGAFAVGAVDFSAAEKARLAAGKTVRQPLSQSGRDGFYAGTGYAVIDAPVEVVWRAIQDWGSYHRVYPKTVEVREVGRKGDRSLVRMQLGHEMISLVYHVDITADESRRVLSFDLVRNKPHDIEEARGYWRLFQQKDGRTLAAYVVASRVPMGVVNLLSASMAEKIERNLLDTPGNLKKWIEGPQGNRYRDAVASR
ncbi:MAG TPA: SRPBCC family protein [Phycisphaerae bacterium]|nr:SRPBCC family protein [Phycisphaerae bacterium]